MSQRGRRARFYCRQRIKRNPWRIFDEFRAWEGWDRLW